MRFLIPAFSMTLLYGVAPALAETCNPADETQMGMNICAAEEYKAADKKLNEAYQKVVAANRDDSESEHLLKTSQRAWIAFRDAECAFSVKGYEGGSMAPMILSMCLANLTTARTAQLDAYMDM